MGKLSIRLSALFFIALSTALASVQDDAFSLEDHVKTLSLEVGNFSVVDAVEGPAVVLMHGFPDTKEVWESQIKALSRVGYRVIAPDTRGRGESWSPLQVELYTLDKIQQDVLDIMDVIEIDQAHLVGHDRGALMAWNMAASHAERFLTATVVSIGHPSSPAFSGFPEMSSSWYIYLFLQEGPAEQTLASYDWEFFRQLAMLRKDLDGMLDRLSGPNQLTTGLNYYRANLQGFLA